MIMVDIVAVVVFLVSPFLLNFAPGLAFGMMFMSLFVIFLGAFDKIYLSGSAAGPRIGLTIIGTIGSAVAAIAIIIAWFFMLLGLAFSLGGDEKIFGFFGLISPVILIGILLRYKYRIVAQNKFSKKSSKLHKLPI